MRAKFFITSLVFLLLTTLGLYTSGQEQVYQLSLDDVLEIAHKQSPDALIAKHRYRSNYWQFRSYQAEYRPMLMLDATLPNYSRSIDVITQPDGSEVFIRRQIARTSANLSLTQNIPFTGGELFVNSSLQRIDNLTDSADYSSYMTTPVNIGIRQPIFDYNPYKWDTKIEPIRYEEAKRRYLEDLEDVSITATMHFFQLLLAQINLQIQLTNQANNDTLYQIARGRYNIGTIAENELLQMELNWLNSNSNVENSRLDYEMKLFNLRSYLRIKDDVAIELIPPTETPDFKVQVQDALLEARENRSEALAFDRRLLEAASDVSRAKMEGRFNMDLFAGYGLAQSSNTITGAYEDPLDEQQLFLGISLPILDWGLSKGNIKMAESNEELIKTSVEQDQIDFDQEIFLKVMQFNMQYNQLMIAAKSDTVAEKRYDVTKQRFMIGTIDIIELNLAQNDKDSNKQAYIAALYSYWSNYYDLRKLTLFDWENKKRLTVDFDALR